jgi:RimJ/RimL family protein N-acetyltransferase
LREPARSRPIEVQLRDLVPDDLPTFFEHQLEPEGVRMAAFPPRDREAFMAHCRTRVLGDESVDKKTILVDGQVAGNVVSFERDGVREVGYWIGREYWGKGVASRALAAFLGHVRVRPLYAHVAKHNVASRRVLEKCGLRMVGEDRAPAPTGGEAVDEFVLILQR